MAEFYLVNGQILDVEAGSFFKANLKISGKKIVSVEESVPEGTKTIDCSGKYLVPGIMDAHVHLVWEGTAPDPMYETVRDGDYLNFAKGVSGAIKSLKAGVTTVRDVGCNDDCTIPMAHAVHIGLIQGTNIVPCGGAIQGSYGHCPMIGSIANTKEQLIDKIKRLKGYNIEMSIPPLHWIKIMASGGAAGLEDVGPCMYSPDELKAIAYEAHRLNMKVAAHALSYDAISKCVDAGIDTIEHGGALDEELLQKMKENGQVWVPTLQVYKELARGRGVIADVIVEKASIVEENQKKAFAAAMKIGTKIVAGSDAGSPNFGPHPSIFKEMIAMEENGMPAEKVIRSATLTAAEELGVKDRGILAAGKIADIVVLDANPLENLHAFTENLSAVYKEGCLV
ncbi:MAG: amidohydrolase family protein [Otoolea sp.]